MKASLLKKHLPLLASLLCLGFCLCVFGGVWLLKVRPAQSKSTSVRVSDDYSLYTENLEDSLTQTFSCSEDLYALAFVFGVTEVQPQGEILLTLADAQTGEVLAQSRGEMGNILPGQYSGLGLDRVVEGREDACYTLTLTPSYQGEGRLSLGYSGSPAEGVELTADSQALEGQLALLVTTGQIGSFLSRYYWLVALALSLILSLTLWAVLALRPALHRLYFVLVLSLGLVYCLVLPPYSAPDEQFHINQSFSIATTLTSRLPLGSVPLSETYRRPSDQNPLLQDQNTTVFTWQEFAETLLTRSPDSAGDFQLYTEMQADDSDMLYLVSSLAVALCFVLKLGFTPTLVIGRLANLAVYALLTSWAIKKAPFGKKIFACVGLLPMSLHLAASFSRDCLTLSLAFLFTALCLDAAFGGKSSLKPFQWGALILTGVLLVPAKAVYFPLAALFLLIPAARFGRQAKRSRLLKGGFLLLCVLAFLSSGARYTIAGLFNRADSAEELAAQIETMDESVAESWNLEEQAQNPDSICYSPGYILSHPAQTLVLVGNSLIENSEHYLKTLVGGKLSYYSLDLSWGWVLLLYLLLAFSLLPEPGERDWPRPSGRIFAALLALSCMGLAVAGCITWTPTYYTSIYGLQGRYFLPALPLLCLALQPCWLSRSKPSGALPALYMAFANAGVLLNAFLAILAR